MLILIGSSIIPAIGITAAWLMRWRLRWGWWLLLLNQGIWVVYAPLTHQWGLAVGAFLYGAGILNNLTGYVDRVRAKLGFAPTARPAVTGVNTELLDALERLISCLDSNLEIGLATRQQARAAIAKAQR